VPNFFKDSWRSSSEEHDTPVTAIRVQQINIRTKSIILEIALLKRLVAFIGHRPFTSCILTNIGSNPVVVKVHALL
jgi:hypothetical protein